MYLDPTRTLSFLLLRRCISFGRSIPKTVLQGEAFVENPLAKSHICNATLLLILPLLRLLGGNIRFLLCSSYYKPALLPTPVIYKLPYMLCWLLLPCVSTLSHPYYSCLAPLQARYSRVNYHTLILMTLLIYSLISRRQTPVPPTYAPTKNVSLSAQSVSRPDTPTVKALP